MIRTTSLGLQLGANQVIITVGWEDPELKRLRTVMVKDIKDALERFKKRHAIVGGNFTLEDIAKFLVSDKISKPDHVHIVDASTGAGVTWYRARVLVSMEGEISQVPEGSRNGDHNVYTE